MKIVNNNNNSTNANTANFSAGVNQTENYILGLIGGFAILGLAAILYMM